MNTIKRGDVFFCLGSPDAVGSEERKTRPVVIVQNNAGNASSPTVIVAWRKTAEFVAKYFRKGQRVIVAQGRIKVDQYTDKEGNKQSRFSVVADEVEFADSKRNPEDRPAGSVAAEYMENGGFEELDGEDGELPF